MPPWLLALGSVLGISLLSLAGVFTLSLGRARLERIVFLLVAFAVGAMLGGALLHLLPEAYERLGSGPKTGALVLAGVLAFFVLEKVLHWHHHHAAPEVIEGATGHCHAGHDHRHDPPPHSHHGHGHIAEPGAPFALMNLVGSVAHNFIDGAIVAAAYLVSVPTGIVTTMAVVLHEIPQEIGNFGVLVFGGYEPKRALLYNFLSGLAGVLGAGVALTVGEASPSFADALLPLTAGAFIYIAGSDLIPELNRRHSYPFTKSVGQLVMIALGVGVMGLGLLLEH